MGQVEKPGLEKKGTSLNNVSKTGRHEKGTLTDGQAQLMSIWGAFGDTYLPYRLQLLGKLIDRRASEHVARVNLSLAEWRVMAHIRRFGMLTISGISRAALVDRAEVCRAAASLERAGFLRREANPGNRRSQLLQLTEEGEDLFRTISEGRVAFFEDVCSVLTAAERKAMESGLRKMALRVSEQRL
jgi:DNA-binding MarR family transcriptional regulator